MGIFNKLFGGRGARCGKCGKSVEPPEQLMTIFTTEIERWSIEGMSGYCPACRQYLCSDHIEFRNEQGLTSGMGSYFIACRSDGTALRTRP